MGGAGLVPGSPGPGGIHRQFLDQRLLSVLYERHDIRDDADGPLHETSKAVERETNPLRVLVVPVGNAALPYASQYSAAANEQVQLAMQTISRIFPVRDGTGELNATTGGVLFTVLPTLIDVPVRYR